MIFVIIHFPWKKKERDFRHDHIDAFSKEGRGGRSKLYDETKSMFGPQEPTEYLSISVIHAMDSVLKGPARIGRVPTISRHDSYGDSPAVIHRMLLIRVSANVSITRNHEDRENNGAQTLDSRHACRVDADREKSFEK